MQIAPAFSFRNKNFPYNKAESQNLIKGGTKMNSTEKRLAKIDRKLDILDKKFEKAMIDGDDEAMHKWSDWSDYWLLERRGVLEQLEIEKKAELTEAQKESVKKDTDVSILQKLNPAAMMGGLGSSLISGLFNNKTATDVACIQENGKNMRMDKEMIAEDEGIVLNPKYAKYR